MWDMKKPAERIGQGVNSGAGRIGKGLPRNHRPDEHIITGVNIFMPIFHRADNCSAKFAQGGKGERVGDRVFKAYRGIGLNRVDHGVNPRRRCNRGRQTQRKLRVEHNAVSV